MIHIYNLGKFIIKIYRRFRIDLILSIVFFHISLLINLPKIFFNKSDKDKTILISEGGFGHTIHDVEIVKLTIVDNFIIIILSEHNRHNWKLVNIWKNIKVIHILKTVPFFSKETHIFMQNYCTNIIYIIHAIFKKKIIEFDNNYNKDYLKPENSVLKKLISKSCYYEDYDFIKPNLKTNKIDYSSAYKDPNDPWYEGYYAYIFLKKKLNFNIVQLNNRIKKNFLKKQIKFNINNDKIVHIYLRQKGKDNRCGSSIEEWSKVIEYLNRKNFLVYITGDININKFPPEIRNKIYSHDKFKMRKDIFNICAPYFCDYNIFEMGGGSWFGVVMNKPSLMVNCLNYWGSAYGINYRLLFKNLMDEETNQYIPLSKSLKNYFWHTDLPENIRLENNNSEQIIEGFEDLFMNKKLMYFKDINKNTKYSWGRVSNALLVSSNIMD